MTNKEALHARRDAVVGMFRDALRLKLELWDKAGDIEQIVGGVDGLENLLDDYASGFGGLADVATVESDDIVAEIEKILESPDAEAGTDQDDEDEDEDDT